MIKIRKVAKRISRPIIRLFVVWIVVVLTIQVLAPSPTVNKMPENCPENSGNCVRVDYNGSSYRYNNLEPPIISASTSEINEVISGWFSDEGGKILFSSMDENSGSNFLHIKENTDFFFFPDDVYVNSRCLEDSNLSVVILQSQSRLGNGDLGINFERLSELISYLNNYSWSGNDCNLDN